MARRGSWVENKFKSKIKHGERAFNMAPYTFAVGDRIRLKGNISDTIGHTIVDIREGYYWCDADITIPHSKQHLFEKFE